MPVFTIKAKDNFALDAVLAYHDLLRKTGRMVEQAGEVWKALEEIADWRDRHPTLCKDPDHKHVPVADPDPVDAGEVERLRKAWLDSAEEMDWIADIDESGIEQRQAERIAKETIARFIAALSDPPHQEAG